MGSRRGPEQTIGQDFKMKLLLAACMLGLATAGQDYQMFMKWAKTKALESCWGEENMKLHTVNMKKAVAKCQQVDAPELNLPPFRLLNRFTNNLVGLAYKMEDQDNEMQRYMQYYKFSKMKLCMYQDTKKKIEANFGPVDELVEGFNNQLTEEQVFWMVNQLLQGSEDEFM